MAQQTTTAQEPANAAGQAPDQASGQATGQAQAKAPEQAASQAQTKAPEQAPARPRKKLDPNSAKYKLNAIVAEHYKSALEAKERGEKVGWCASNFPQEIFETLGVKVCYPENHAAATAARGGGERMCNIAEAAGYSNDLCAYARVNLGVAMTGKAEEQPIPMPDFMLCCNNICNTMTKWYEELAKMLHIPMIMIDVPFNPDYDVSPAQIEYVKGQFMDAIRQLEEITGKTWSEERFAEVMAISNRTSRAWLKAASLLKHTPAPYNGFDLMNHMAVAVCARGKVEAAEAFETLCKEIEAAVAEGKTTFRGEEKHRIMFEGIACWPHLRVTNTALRDLGMNTVATIYAVAFGMLYEDFDGLIRAYCSVPNSVNLEKARDQRIELVKSQNVQGMLVHTNRSCKLWSGFMSEASRQVCAECSIPLATFDGDQADPRNFSEAQYETRVQGLAEVMEEMGF